MTPARLKVIGRALFGDRWQSELGRRLKVNDRTVRRWVRGDRRPGPGVLLALASLMERRGAGLLKLAAALRRDAKRKGKA